MIGHHLTSGDESEHNRYLQTAAMLEGRPEHPPQELLRLHQLEPLVSNPATILDQILTAAAALQASDIHIEVRQMDVRVRLRIDGELYPVFHLPRETHAQLISRVKIVASMDIAEKRVPQDGRFVFRYEQRDIDCRTSTLPTVYGEKAVIRILDRLGLIRSIDQLGLNRYNLGCVAALAGRNHGLILVTGPTGSGKTSTLYALIHSMDRCGKNIVTLEEPVEYTLDDVNQVQIHPRVGLTFAGGLRSILRQDPDVIMVGEIRDNETAQLAVHAALTGHLVLSTLHTHSAAATIARLTDMKIEPYLLAAALSGVISQRLVRLLCPRCRQSYRMDKRNADSLHMEQLFGMEFFRQRGCSECHGLGYKGRTAIQEVLIMGKLLKKAVYSGCADEDNLEELGIQAGMIPALEDGIQKARLGLTSVEEIIKAMNRVGG